MLGNDIKTIKYVLRHLVRHSDRTRGPNVIFSMIECQPPPMKNVLIQLYRHLHKEEYTNASDFLNCIRERGSRAAVDRQCLTSDRKIDAG